MSPARLHLPRAVLTLALGPDVYWNLALNLARSIRRRHGAADLPVFIATDRTDPIPSDLPGVEAIRLQRGELGRGFETKLHLDRLAPARCTLFIDADCLVYGSLDDVFMRMKGRAVATVGGAISEGDWFGDVPALCRRLGVASIPEFNGGLYYLEPGELAGQVYSRARALVASYDDWGLIRLRGLPNEELLMASAMALHGLTALPDDGTVMGDPQCYPDPVQVNIITGRRLLRNPPPSSPVHRARSPVREASPVIVHFLNDHTHRTPYLTDVRRLGALARGRAAWLADLEARFTVELPGRARALAKDTLRPLYRRLFGARDIPKSDRLA